MVIHAVSGLFWISTHQFALVLTPSGTPIGEDDGLPPPSHFMILTALVSHCYCLLFSCIEITDVSLVEKEGTGV